jgi:Zn finger protein HypA/HybF involved in hydrogenase expression
MTDEIGFSEFIHQLKSVIEAEYQGNCRPAARGTYRRRFDLIDGRRRAKKRPCLRCQKTFISEHPGNRICEPCRRVNANVPLGMEMAV